MCWRNDVPQARTCSFCGRTYFGSLGHGCNVCSICKKPKIMPHRCHGPIGLRVPCGFDYRAEGGGVTLPRKIDPPIEYKR